MTYSSKFSDFIRLAPESEKERVYKQVLERSMEDQMSIVEAANKAFKRLYKDRYKYNWKTGSWVQIYPFDYLPFFAPKQRSCYSTA